MPNWMKSTLEKRDPIIVSIDTLPFVESSNVHGHPEKFQLLAVDPDCGFYVERFVNPAGAALAKHSHSCAHGIYVLSGKLKADGKYYGPGTFIWLPQGSEMDHGSAEDEGVEYLFIWTGISIKRGFDINMVDEAD
jgi:Uncharacterized conserved protein, contains double-stranded beta-helix domain